MDRRTFLSAIPAMGLLTSCRKTSRLKLALNWKPEPEFGGFYAAPYSKHGVDVDVIPGGTGTPTVQMIGAGSVTFGIVGGDELVLARSRGNDVVALFAAFQNNPAGIMVHASRGLKSIGDVFRTSGTVALQSGLPYAQMLKEEFGFDRVQIVPSPGGDITTFLNDPNFAQQCYVTSEPLAARRRGADVKVFPISDIGFNPYATVLATSGETLRKNPAMVASVVAAVREGWRAYLDDPGPVDATMQKLNPTMDSKVFAEVAEAQKPLIQTPETGRDRLGMMTEERWAALIRQLKGLGLISQTVRAEECFRSV